MPGVAPRLHMHMQANERGRVHTDEGSRWRVAMSGTRSGNFLFYSSTTRAILGQRVTASRTPSAEFRGDLAVTGDREDVFAVFVLVDGEDLGDEAGADRVGLAGDRVDGDLHSADIRPRGRALPERLCHGTGTESGICDWRGMRPG